MSNIRVTQLDFSLLPSLETGSLFAKLPRDLDQKLQPFSATYDRAYGALSFTARMCNTTPSADNSDLKLREAFLRAALGEYVSMEETIRYENDNCSRPKIINSKNPLLHIMKQLRNMQFHLLSSPLTSGKQDIVWKSKEFSMQFWYIEDIKINNFNKLESGKYYSNSDKLEMIQWFNHNQRKWGISELIIKSVSMYIHEILS